MIRKFILATITGLICLSTIPGVAFASDGEALASGEGCQDVDAHLVSGGKAGIELYSKNVGDRRYFYGYNGTGHSVIVTTSDGEETLINDGMCEPLTDTNGTSIRITKVR